MTPVCPAIWLYIARAFPEQTLVAVVVVVVVVHSPVQCSSELNQQCDRMIRTLVGRRRGVIILWSESARAR